VSIGVERREYLAVKEAAVLLRVSPSAVYRAVERGSLPAFRLSNHGTIRIPRAALEPEPRP
jgi:excisionase family DNA binding protein